MVDKSDEPVVIKKKRGRKPKSETSDTVPVENVEPHVPKKRGRKPKGGKLTNKIDINTNEIRMDTNIILHLKCTSKDIHNEMINPLEYNPSIPPIVEAYKDNKYEEQYIFNKDNITNESSYNDKLESKTICNKCLNNISDTHNDDNIKMKDINQKIKSLKIQLYKNENTNIKAACFWCTYEFDNPTCYIPKFEMDDEIFGYGSFCRPECAAAFLLHENIDDSMKYERYHLLNKTYSKIYDFKHNIKPAPNPYYLLDKFYGNLSIQEYRKLLKTQHMLLVVDKPMSRILPELHDDNEEVILTNNSHKGTYKVKRANEHKSIMNKNEIVKEQFMIK